MTDIALMNQLKNDDILMESFHEMAISQEGKDRLKYIDIVTEAFGDPEKQSGLLNKLYKEIQKVEEIDFGKIPDSKGDVTKYVYYDQMYSCMEVLNEMVEGKPTPNIATMNKLHQILLNNRLDFTFGFRAENFVIINLYNLMVTSLYEMLNICIVDATEYLRNKLSMNPVSPTPKQIRWTTKNANQLIKVFESGQWNLIVKTFKSNGNTITVASEAINININTDPQSPRGNLINDVAKSGSSIINGIKQAPGVIWNGFKNHKVAGVIVALITLFIIIRKAIYYFINCSGKLSDRVKNVAAVLRANAAAETSDTALEKQKKLLDNLDNISDTIDYKIVKSEKAAEADMKNGNKAEFSPQEISNISGADFEI